MKKLKARRLRMIIFTLVGALAGLAYYYFVGCSSGSCAIVSNPISSMAYMGFIGWLVSGAFGAGCQGKCNM